MIFKNIILLMFLMVFSLNCVSSYSQSGDTEFISDNTILKTDNEGNILGGDQKDWNFSMNSYMDIQKFIVEFAIPFYKGNVIPAIGSLEPITAEVNDQVVILKWVTAVETDNKGFYVERSETVLINGIDNWLKLGFVKGYGNSDSARSYKFIDSKVKTGIKYKYRLKQVSFNNEIEYYQLSREVLVMYYQNQFAFYPAYPNPVSEMVTFSFYLPKKDIVSLYFLNDNNIDTTFLLDQEPQEKGFYKVIIDKESLSFDNEIKRLYISCKSCDKKKNFGDIQF